MLYSNNIIMIKPQIKYDWKSFLNFRIYKTYYILD